MRWKWEWMDRKLLKEKQIQLIFQLEQEENRFIRKRLIEELEFFEALGDREKRTVNGGAKVAYFNTK